MATSDQIYAVMNKITKEFADEPLAVNFARPFVNEEDKKTMTEYSSRIKHPMDLQTVRKKIKDKQYAGYQSWINDMNLIWDNAVEFNTAESIIGGVAIYLKKKFQKKIMSLYMKNNRNYEAHLKKLIKDVQKIISEPPASFNVQVVPNWSPNADEFSISRVRAIMDGVAKLDKLGKTSLVLRTIKDHEPGFIGGPDSTIDFGVFGKATLLALEELIKNEAN